MSANDHNPARMYSRTELEEAIKNAAQATAELTKKSVITELEEKGLLKEDTPPGTTKKFLAGLLSKGTKHVTALTRDIIQEGECALVGATIKSLDDKAKAKRIKEALEQIDKEFM